MTQLTGTQIARMIREKFGPVGRTVVVKNALDVSDMIGVPLDGKTVHALATGMIEALDYEGVTQLEDGSWASRCLVR